MDENSTLQDSIHLLSEAAHRTLGAYTEDDIVRLVDEIRAELAAHKEG